MMVSAISVLVIAACDQFSTFQRLGVSIDDDGSMQIHYLACDYEQLAAVRLVNSHEDAGDEDDEVLWEIRSESGDDGGVFLVGSQPEGFIETAEFDGSYPANDILVAAVEIEESVGAALDFTIADLEAGKVFTIGKPNSNIDVDAFEDQARNSCEPAQ